MVAALYRRYRPDAFAEMIGQSQVTEPLMTALRTGRVNHAYLFSGPRGCGKTSSARILARCLNCAEGPTDTPCGHCDSCRELARDGGGSLDVIEIDAASHGGVDDARELRERAILAPSRDRYKIFIIDEAHMVTSAGFNALLKVVEEPPEHVRFVFATTEPEKVIGTIRSRTHHFPFRLIPPALMLEYVEQLCASEGVVADAGVLPLVVRAGGGSARDTLSLLDQIIAGSETGRLDYQRAAALLGFTSTELLDATVEAFAGGDARAAYEAVDGVIQSGQDPRRFVEDLLERVRDLILVVATGQAASQLLRGIGAGELERLAAQARRFTPASLSQTADLINATLSEMTGVTPPRLHLELMAARILVAGRAHFAGADAAASVGAVPPGITGSAASASGASVPDRAARGTGPVTAARATADAAPSGPPRPGSEPGAAGKDAPAAAASADRPSPGGPSGSAAAQARQGTASGIVDGDAGTSLHGTAWATAVPGTVETTTGPASPPGAAAQAVPVGPVPPLAAAPGAADAAASAGERAPGSSAASRRAAPKASSQTGHPPRNEAVPDAVGLSGREGADSKVLGLSSPDSAAHESVADVVSSEQPPSAAETGVAARPGTAPAAVAETTTDQPQAVDGVPAAAPRHADGGSQDTPASSSEAAVPSFAQLRDAWPTVLERVRGAGGVAAWSAVSLVEPRDLVDGVLRFEVESRSVLERFRASSTGATAPSDLVREAIRALFGITVKFQPRLVERRDGDQAGPDAHSVRGPLGADGSTGAVPPWGGGATGVSRSAGAPRLPDDGAERDGAEGRTATRTQATEGGATTSGAPDAGSVGSPARTASRGGETRSKRGGRAARPESAAPGAGTKDAATGAAGLSWSVAAIPGAAAALPDGPGSAWAEAAYEVDAAGRPLVTGGPAEAKVLGLSGPDGAARGSAAAAADAVASAPGAPSAQHPVAEAPGARQVSSPVEPTRPPLARGGQPSAPTEAHAPAAERGLGAPAPAASTSAFAGVERYGEAVIRELLGARFVGEEPLPEPPSPASDAGDDVGTPPPDDAEAPPDFEAPPEED